VITKVRTSEEETEQNRLSQKEKKSHDSIDEGFKQRRVAVDGLARNRLIYI